MADRHRHGKKFYYTLQEKADIVEEAPVYPAPRNAEERSVIKKQKENYTRHSGKPSTLSNDDKFFILAMFEEYREQGIPVSANILSIDLMRERQELQQLRVEVIRRRILCFLRTEFISTRAITHMSQNTRFCQNIINDFVTYVNRQIIAGKYTAPAILNADETNIDFDPVTRHTLDRVGTKTVNLRINGHSGRCTVMLACSLSGHKLPAFVIWKGVQGGRISRDIRGAGYPHANMKYTVQHTGWMDTTTYDTWVQQVLHPYFNQQHGYLIQDSFSVHLHRKSIRALNDIGVETDFIPGGCTPVLQVMDKGVFKPFKDYIRQESTTWKIQHAHGTKPTREDIAHWIQHSWDRVDVDTITNTWQLINYQPYKP